MFLTEFKKNRESLLQYEEDERFKTATGRYLMTITDKIGKLKEEIQIAKTKYSRVLDVFESKKIPTDQFFSMWSSFIKDFQHAWEKNVQKY